MRSMYFAPLLNKPSKFLFGTKHIPFINYRNHSYKIQAVEGIQPEIGEKLRTWVKSPFDIAAFGPRVTVGSFLTAPDKLQKIPTDIQKLSELIQDSNKAPNQKIETLLYEIESRLVDSLEKGATIERDILNNIKIYLPDNLKNIIPKTPEVVPPRARNDYGDNDMGTGFPVTSDIDNNIITAERVTSEKDAINEAISSAKNALDAYKTNKSEARKMMLLLNVKESRDNLKTILKEVKQDDPGINTFLDDGNVTLKNIEDEIGNE